MCCHTNLLTYVDRIILIKRSLIISFFYHFREYVNMCMRVFGSGLLTGGKMTFFIIDNTISYFHKKLDVLKSVLEKRT